MHDRSCSWPSSPHPFARVPRFGGLWTAGMPRIASAMPEGAIEPDEPPTWAGEQHRQCSRLKDPGRPVRSLGTHRVMHPPAASKSQNIWVADLHRLAGPLPPSVRLPSEGWSAVVCCDGCNVRRCLIIVNRLGLIFEVSDPHRRAGTKKPPRWAVGLGRRLGRYIRGLTARSHMRSTCSVMFCGRRSTSGWLLA